MMKKIKILTLIFCLGFITTINSQSDENTERLYVLKTNPFASLASGIWLGPIIPLTAEYPRITFEYAKDYHGFMISGGYLGWSFLGNIQDEQGEKVSDLLSNNGFKVQGLYKYYFAGDGLNGFYVGPHLSFSYSLFKEKENTSNSLAASNLITSAAIGYQFISEGGFSFDFFTGFGYQSKRWNTSGDGADLGEEDINGFNGFKVPFVINFGYAF
jgi:hypothetical protein